MDPWTFELGVALAVIRLLTASAIALIAIEVTKPLLGRLVLVYAAVAALQYPLLCGLLDVLMLLEQVGLQIRYAELAELLNAGVVCSIAPVASAVGLMLLTVAIGVWAHDQACHRR
jgi:hypothetical protein